MPMFSCSGTLNRGRSFVSYSLWIERHAHGGSLDGGRLFRERDVGGERSKGSSFSQIGTRGSLPDAIHDFANPLHRSKPVSYPREPHLRLQFKKGIVGPRANRIATADGPDLIASFPLPPGCVHRGHSSPRVMSGSLYAVHYPERTVVDALCCDFRR